MPKLAVTQQTAPHIQLDIHVSPQAEQKLQAAASIAQRSVAEFVLESALMRADETLADRTRFGLDADRWKALLEALDADPRDLPRLRRLFEERSAFETGATT